MDGEKHIPEQSSPPGGYTQTAIPAEAQLVSASLWDAPPSPPLQTA